jgi:hypothetical protein
VGEQGRLFHHQALRLRHLPPQQNEDREAMGVEVTALDHLRCVADPRQLPKPTRGIPGAPDHHTLEGHRHRRGRSPRSQRRPLAQPTPASRQEVTGASCSLSKIS